MAGREHWLARGATLDQLPHAMRWEDHLSGLGWSREQIDRFITWGLEQDAVAAQRPRSFSREEFIDRAYALGAELGVDVGELGVAEETFARVESEGWPEEKTMPLSNADRLRRDELIAQSGAAKGSEAWLNFWKKGGSDELFALNERAAGDSTPAKPTVSGDSDARLAELINMSGAPKGSDAWRAYWKNGGDAEHRAILKTQLGETTGDGNIGAE